MPGPPQTPATGTWLAHCQWTDKPPVDAGAVKFKLWSKHKHNNITTYLNTVPGTYPSPKLVAPSCKPMGVTNKNRLNLTSFGHAPYLSIYFSFPVIL
jgi:hypothetical protein